VPTKALAEASTFAVRPEEAFGGASAFGLGRRAVANRASVEQVNRFFFL
jgi:hypothetical protein